MIVSHRHRFIFIKTRKTASTSVELYLRQFCGPDDIITHDTDEDERLARDLGLPGPQNIKTTYTMPWRMRGRDLWWARTHRRYPRRYDIKMHADAATIRSYVGEDVWNSYVKITTVRDPWDATVSLYYWRRSSRSPNGPDRTIDTAVDRAARNWESYTIDGVPVVDHVIRYEQLARDVQDVCDQLGLVATMPLHVAKGGLRPERSPASEVLSPNQARRVAEIARDEIAWLGYEWSGPDLGLSSDGDGPSTSIQSSTTRSTE